MTPLNKELEEKLKNKISLVISADFPDLEMFIDQLIYNYEQVCKELQDIKTKREK